MAAPMLKDVRFVSGRNVFKLYKFVRSLRGEPRGEPKRVYQFQKTKQATVPLQASVEPEEEETKSNEKSLHKTEKLKKEIEKEVTIQNQYIRLAETVTPLWRMPYEKQLQIKYKKCMKSLNRLGYEMRKANCKYISSSGAACPLRVVIPSPVINGYRNKDEFSIRPGPDGHPKTVGFFIGSPADYSNVVSVGPDHLVNIKDSHKKVAQLFQEYIDQSPLDACVDFNHGHWRNLIVRSNVHDELMAIAVMHPQNLSEEELMEEKEKLAAYFFSGKGQEFNLKSLYFQACRHTRCTHEQAPFDLIRGEPYITEEVKQFKFRISPESFFQVNTLGASILFDTVKELVGLKENLMVLDVCCGTGTFSLFLSDIAKGIVGIESSTQAVEDAIANAELNHVTNAAFYTQKAEKFLPEILPDLYSENLVVLLNPARGGLKNSVISVLRECKHLRRIIYISCKPEGAAMGNFLQLCRPPKKYVTSTEPFVPVLATPIDLFPHTDHCELVILFERF